MFLKSHSILRAMQMQTEAHSDRKQSETKIFSIRECFCKCSFRTVFLLIRELLDVVFFKQRKIGKWGGWPHSTEVAFLLHTQWPLVRFSAFARNFFLSLP